ncbi:MAG: hypothetical protein K8I82_07780, partial [Anaerolineae bacterium]|nr:hypothetical protein [Anaerolineae bacterium]
MENLLQLARAHWVQPNLIAWTIAPDPTTFFRLHFDPHGTIELT